LRKNKPTRLDRSPFPNAPASLLVVPVASGWEYGLVKWGACWSGVDVDAKNTMPPPDAPTKKRKSNLLAAFCSSSLYTFSTYPFHRVKVLIQTQDANPAVLLGSTRRFHFLSAFSRLLAQHGGKPIGLWHGCTPYLLRHIPSVSVSFAAKDAFRAALLPVVGVKTTSSPPPPPSRLLAANAVSGGLAGALALALVYPFEFLTIRMSADVGGGGGSAAAATGLRRTTTTTTSTWQFGRSPLDAARSVIAVDGVRGLYRGFGPAVSSAACYKALYFGLHDSAKEYAFDGRYASSGPSSPSPPPPPPLWRAALERLCIASGTTATAAALTHPLDVVRKRLVVDSEGKLYGGTFNGCVRGIWQREGVRGFLRFLPQDVFLRMGAGTILVTYDMLTASTGGVSGGVGGG
jgi:solute carrier family 25 (adenine nucleotide translocator) protein 4/5/6/31